MLSNASISVNASFAEELYDHQPVPRKVCSSDDCRLWLSHPHSTTISDPCTYARIMSRGHVRSFCLICQGRAKPFGGRRDDGSLNISSPADAQRLTKYLDEDLDHVAKALTVFKIAPQASLNPSPTPASTSGARTLDASVSKLPHDLEPLRTAA